MKIIKAILDWIIKYVQLIGAGLAVLGSVIIAVGWHLKNKKIDELQYQLAISQTKFRIESLAAQYKTTILELNELRKTDLSLDKQIASVEVFLNQKLKSGMTVEEIAQKFKEIGISPKVLGNV